jgi:hypothetical protein
LQVGCEFDPRCAAVMQEVSKAQDLALYLRHQGKNRFYWIEKPVPSCLGNFRVERG